MTARMPPVLAGDCHPQALARAIEFCKANCADHQVPLFQAVGTGRIALTALPDRLTRPNINALRKARRPALILVGDDDGGTTGPLGWAATAQMLGWAHGAFVHGSGGDRASYMTAILMAQDYGRLLLVETSSDAVESWATALLRADVRTICLKPTGNGVHPVDLSERAAS